MGGGGGTLSDGIEQWLKPGKRCQAHRCCQAVAFVSGALQSPGWIVCGWSDATVSQLTVGVRGACMTIGGGQAAIWLTRLFIVIDVVVIALLAACILRGRQVR